VKLRLVLVENEGIVRQGLRRLLELDAEIDVVGEAGDGQEAIDVIVRVRPDVVLLDLRMPRLDGIGVLTGLRARAVAVPCIVLTTFDDPDALLRAARAGAKGWLLKDAPFEELVLALREVAAGRTYLQPALTNGLVRGFDAIGGSAAGDGEPEPLTDREHDVLRLMAGGYANKEIADALGVAERTVKNHVSSVLAKLGVRDRTRAVLKALERRLL
jgi:DNA-binding NarL/FixJ family response regulator